MFDYEMRVRLQHTDAAGVVFFSEQFALAHAAYEAYLASQQLPLEQFIDEGEVHLPIIHADADFQAPLRLGDRLHLQLRSDRVGDSSFALATRIIRADDGTVTSEITTVHVAVDSEAREKVALPDRLRAVIEGL
jgi:YbgC/YbaW family acyl-CoA thioester hydrolase